MNSVERIKAALEGRVPDRVPVMEMIIDPHVINGIVPGMSYEDFIDYCERPEYVRKLAQIGVDYHVELYRKLIAEGVEVVVLGDDYAGKTGPFMSPAHFAEFILPGLNIDVDLLSRSSVEQVRAATRELLARVSPLGGHILSSGNTIANSVRPENYRAMLEVARQFGRYRCGCRVR